MKIKLLFALLFSLFMAQKGFCQINVSYHQSSLPFLAVGYEFPRFTPELRISTDVFTDDFSAEVVVPYKIIRKDDYYVDAGLGLRLQHFGGLLVPIGLTVFPFDKKDFGFHTEIALISIAGGVSPALRGSWGITYRFRRSE